MPTARAYGSKGAQTPAAAHATDNRCFCGDRTPYTGDTIRRTPYAFPTGHQRRPGPSDPMPQTCHSQRATTVNSDHPEIRCTAGRKRSQHGHPDSQAEYAGSTPVIGSTVSQRERCWGRAVRWSRTPACTPSCRGGLTFCYDTLPLLTSGAARCWYAHTATGN